MTLVCPPASEGEGCAAVAPQGLRQVGGCRNATGTKLGLRLARRHSRPPPDSWGVSAGAALCCAHSCAHCLPGSRCCTAEPRQCLLQAALLHPEQAGDITRACVSPGKNPAMGWRGMWAQAAADLGKGCSGDAQVDGNDSALCLLVRGRPRGVGGPCLATTTG